uniref:BTB domain-containing protein n=1 Tax=Setaria italica TaxID=4555 RepID=K3Z4E9_SETIT
MAAAAVAAKTASSHRASFAQGTHQFDIVGYGALKALGRSHSITSGTFRVAGRDWAVVCHLDPALAYVSLELAAGDNSGAAVTAMASFAIDDPTGGSKPMQIGDGDEATVFTPSSRALKVPVPDSFRKREARYVSDDRLRIRCTVRVLEEESRPTGYCFVAAPAPPDITGWLATLLESGRRADVTFAVEASRFDAHKLVLALRSPVFRAKFFGDSRDSSQEWFRVYDIGAPVFEAMLRFIYTDEPPPDMTTAMAHDLLVAADLYDLERLRVACEKSLWESVQTDGVSAALSVLLRLNGRQSCHQLEDLCVGYIAGAWDAATATEEYRELKASCPAVLNDILEKLVVEAKASASSSEKSSSSSEKSSSTYRASDVWRGTHQFSILGYSGVRRMHGMAGEFIRSGTFEVGGYEWQILYYPSGYDEYSDDDVAVYLQLVTPIDPDLVVEVAGRFMVGSPNDVNAMVERFGHEFSYDYPVSGIRELATVDDVRSNLVEREAEEEVKKKAGGTSKEEVVVLRVEGITAVAFKALLHFVYTDELPPLDDLVRAATAGDSSVPSSETSRTRMARDLLAAAERYQLVERMRPLCENLLCEVITPEDAAATLELARRHGRQELKAFCLDYMSSPGVLTAVVATDGYKELSAEALRDMLNHIASAAASSS